MTTPHPDQTAATTAPRCTYWSGATCSLVAGHDGEHRFERGCADCRHDPHPPHRCPDCKDGPCKVPIAAPTPIAGRGETTAENEHWWLAAILNIAADTPCPQLLRDELRPRHALGQTLGVFDVQREDGKWVRVSAGPATDEQHPRATPTPETPRPETIAPAKEPDAQMLAYEAWERDQVAAAPSVEGPREERCALCGKIWGDHFGGNFCDQIHLHEEDEPRQFTPAAALPGAQAGYVNDLREAIQSLRTIAEDHGSWDANVDAIAGSVDARLAALTSEVARLREGAEAALALVEEMYEAGHEFASLNQLAAHDLASQTDRRRAEAARAEFNTARYNLRVKLAAARSLTPANPEEAGR